MKTQSMQRLRGSTYIESLVAGVIMTFCLMGLVSLWSFSFNMTRRHDSTSIAYNLARRGIEIIKQKGFNSPEYTSTAPLVYYYDINGGGENTSASINSNFAYKVVITIVSDRMDSLNGVPTRPNESALRTVNVVVQSYPSGVEIVRSGSLLARSGV